MITPSRTPLKGGTRKIEKRLKEKTRKKGLLQEQWQSNTGERLAVTNSKSGSGRARGRRLGADGHNEGEREDEKQDKEMVVEIK
ncbi:hypothetical protein PIB30_052669 [Stylosanthes scabra]|uniref:Uncharacterized protein n=1 Tax=Stylosanthes scabra TaxID=79078 RepID=A0ABU6QHR6_9FABA|nr:hypothetical protein [Stylosanthes scabra]